MRNMSMVCAVSFFLFFCLVVFVASKIGLESVVAGEIPMRGVPSLLFTPGGLFLIPLAILAVLAGWRIGTRISSVGQHEMELQQTLSDQARAYDELRAEYTAQIEKRSQVRRELLSANKRLNILLGSAREIAIIGTNEEGVISFFNSGAEQLLGYGAKEMVERTTPECFHAETELAQWRAHLAEELLQSSNGYDVFKNWALMGSQGKRECTFIRRDGHVRIVEESVGPMRSNEGSIVGYLHIAINITGRKRMEEELLQARCVAEESSRAKSQFLANMGHELRTPLNAIIGYSDMLIEDYSTEDKPTLVDDLQRINRAGHRLLTMINDILDLSKMEAGKVEASLGMIEALPLIRQIEATFRPVAQKSGNEFHLLVGEDIPRLYTDPERLLKCLQHLLDNAAKYTRNGSITLLVERITGASGEQVGFVVEDSGAGMSRDQLRDIFDPFTQGDGSTTREHGGIGLGLSLTKALCKLLNAELSALSEPDKGSRFSIHVPCGVHDSQVISDPIFEKRLAHAGAVLVSARNESAPLILLLGQKDRTVNELAPVLSKAGYQVASLAMQNKSGVDGVDNLAPYAILHRYVVPGMDEWGVINRLKRCKSLTNTAFVIVDDSVPFDVRIVLDTPEFESKPMDGDRLDVLLEKCGVVGTESRVLVIDDDEEARRLLGSLLKKRGLDPLFAENGQVGLEVLENQAVDLLFLDIMMPVMNGFEFLSRFREHPDAASTAVVVLTSRELGNEEREQLSGCVETFAPQTGPGVESLVAFLDARRAANTGIPQADQ